MKKLHKPLTQAKYPENSGGGFSVGLEVFHQLHCLNLVRQYTHFGYYSTLAIPPQPFTDSNATLRLHVGMCPDHRLYSYTDCPKITASTYLGRCSCATEMWVLLQTAGSSILTMRTPISTLGTNVESLSPSWNITSVIG